MSFILIQLNSMFVCLFVLPSKMSKTAERAGLRQSFFNDPKVFNKRFMLEPISTSCSRATDNLVRQISKV